MMCQRIGRPPTSTNGFGRYSVSSRRRVPWPPHKMTTLGTERSGMFKFRCLSRVHPGLDYVLNGKQTRLPFGQPAKDLFAQFRLQPAKRFASVVVRDTRK